MGTLFNQGVRKNPMYDLEGLLHWYMELAKTNGISLSDVIKTGEVIELKIRNDLYRDNGDAWDEQIAGMGKILKDIEEGLNQLEKG